MQGDHLLVCETYKMWKSQAIDHWFCMGICQGNNLLKNGYIVMGKSWSVKLICSKINPVTFKA